MDCGTAVSGDAQDIINTAAGGIGINWKHQVEKSGHQEPLLL